MWRLASGGLALAASLCSAGALRAVQQPQPPKKVGLTFSAPCTYFTREPSLCPQGSNLWSDEELLAALPEFVKVYAERPLKFNAGGVGVNHAFALWFSVKQIKPKYIIESGVFLGQTTYILRKAAPDAQIFSIDPKAEGVTGNGCCWPHFHDDSGKTMYFRGDGFKDLNKIDWDSLIPKDERDQVFVSLDDHMSSVRRSTELLERGFLHLWYDDNWVNHDTYSFNKMCSKPVGDYVELRDNFGRTKTNLTLEQHANNSQWLRGHIETYFEFPALYDGCSDHTRRRSLLRPEELASHGLPEVDEDWIHYTHQYAPYVKLRQ